jgi:16S rRNA G966 N2-methylase RsmD
MSILRGSQMAKKETTKASRPTQGTLDDREEKIINIMCNTSILLMSLMTEAFSDLFAGMAEGMVQAVSSSLGVSEESTKQGSEKMRNLTAKIPQEVRAQMIAMKTDIRKQFQEKKQAIQNVLIDPVFDKGITIAESSTAQLPKLTEDLDEISLLGYLVLLKREDPSCTKMFQALMDWMKTVPQPPKE